MARTEEAAAWFSAVYRAVQQVPVGKVTTYGHIALLLDHPERARQVGVCLKHLPSAPDPDDRYSQLFNGGNVPWQRIINSKGAISPRGPGGAQRQADVLTEEGVEVEYDGMEYRIKLGTFGWFPKALPSEDEAGSGDHC
ncbi:MGMT family protein [Eremomyces bilateralis CBS 781.70]|uniref:MGMT family protein n=1 Tax=Eremomyces bilateralis CBS 781.70 TaxID=1392243 RepID=A0A6G1G9L1_9PEZI|nr:MGMT family protein [Eremomyces bilateralis CBS 781.70]KAF1814682.1 MGMT family protein [Eremomyces bilateralis CBS 781.70]